MSKFRFYGVWTFNVIYHHRLRRDPKKGTSTWNHVLWALIHSIRSIFVTCRRGERICLCVCVFVSKRRKKTSKIFPPKMGEPISVKFCTTTRLPFLNIFNSFVFTGGSNFPLLYRLIASKGGDMVFKVGDKSASEASKIFFWLPTYIPRDLGVHEIKYTRRTRKGTDCFDWLLFNATPVNYNNVDTRQFQYDSIIFQQDEWPGLS